MRRLKPKLRGVEAIRSDLQVWADRAALAVERIAAGERSIRRGQRPASSWARVKVSKAELREARLFLASLRLELARAERWAVWRPPVQLDLWREVA